MLEIIIPTLDPQQGADTGEWAARTCGLTSREARVTVVVDREGHGYTCTVNAALREFPAGDVCLLADDARALTPDWLALLRAAVRERAALNVGFAGPSGPCRTPPQAGGRVGDRRAPRSVSHLAGFCLYVTAAAREAVGLLDERFTHYGSDVDYQWRGAQAGFGALWVPGVYVDHELHAPRSDAPRADWWARDQALLKNLWRERVP